MRKLTLVGVVFILGVSAAVGLYGQASPSSNEAIVNWLRGHAVRLQTVEPRSGLADLQPLEKVVGNARIVALGEATHGTREFFQLKHRMLELLAGEMGFTIFSIEANMPEAYRLNDYVQAGRGDPAALLKGMGFSIWDTEEVLDMIRWMREFNASGRGRVAFTGFDMQMPDLPADIARAFVGHVEPGFSGTFETAWRDVKAQEDQGPPWAAATASLPVAAAAGTRVRYSGYIKTEAIATGFAALSWLVKGDKGTLAFDYMQGRAPRGTTDWTRYEISLTVPAGAKAIEFGVVHQGDGTAWFDGLGVELDGVPYVSADTFDFDFESPSLRGFVAEGAGYQVALDQSVARSGRQSLRIAHVGIPPPASARRASDGWKAVVAHMESSRAAWVRAGATEKDADWAIQNARVVLQFAQKASREQTRDRSMADNITWILDHSPKAKMVVWAHNLHVTAGPMAGQRSEPMGQMLRQTYGSQMVVFGFAFNQGSFQAADDADRMHQFMVPPAPAGSLDATLAATGIPVFAIDLRAAPRTGPVADWLAAPHKTRAIGATFSDAAASLLWDARVRDVFDALLFVEKTTSARAIPAARQPTGQ